MTNNPRDPLTGRGAQPPARTPARGFPWPLFRLFCWPRIPYMFKVKAFCAIAQCFGKSEGWGLERWVPAVLCLLC